jgi:hypothetical protein
LYREGICIPTLRETPGGVVLIKGEKKEEEEEEEKKKDDLEGTHTEIEIEKFVYSFSTI